MVRIIWIVVLAIAPHILCAQINTDRVMAVARSALYFEDYVLSIQYFNQVINAKPYLYEPYFYRSLAKLQLDDFQGAEKDCSEVVARNPFLVGAYQVRGIARIRQGKYSEAIEDYQTALKYDPENITLWHNLTLCHIQNSEYELAKEDIDELLKVSPKYTRGILMRGEIALKQQDTVNAMKDFDLAIELDKYDADTWASRAIVHLQTEAFDEAETDLTQAIHLNNGYSGYYINRALARYHQNNLRGAMSDYDVALDLEPGNFIGHYNRGLLRAQVGDDNRAIEDFDYVLSIEPENMMAIFNRGLLRAQTGDYKGAVSDYSKVIAAHPNFVAGYYYRAEAKRKMGDRRGADLDELQVMNIQMGRRNNASTGGASAQTSDLADNSEEESDEKTRKKSDKNMNNYRKIVTADNTDVEQKYSSDYRGKVQDRNVSIKLEPMFTLAYYEKASEVKRQINYYKYIDDLNRTKVLPDRLLITNEESPLTEDQIQRHFALIDQHTGEMMADQSNPLLYLARAMDFYLVQDFSSALDDLTAAIEHDQTFFPAYFMRATVRYKQLEYLRSEQVLSSPMSIGGKDASTKEIGVVDYETVKSDFNRVLEIAPDFVYAYYNRACLYAMFKDYRAAIMDYDRAIELNPNLAEAYFNRGLTHVFLGNNKQGIADLSKAGELGIPSAYNIIKRFTDSSK